MTGISPSVYYYKRKNKFQQTELHNRIELLSCEFPGYGYRRIAKHLCREGPAVNHKRVLRIMREKSLLCKTKRAYKITTDSSHKYPTFSNLAENIVLTGLNQLWHSDITYIRLAESFIKTLKYEEVYLWEYNTAEEAAGRIEHFIKEAYNRKRLHSVLGYVPLEEYEAGSWKGAEEDEARNMGAKLSEGNLSAVI